MANSDVVTIKIGIHELQAPVTDDRGRDIEKYVNGMMNELSAMAFYRNESRDKQDAILAINLADDYFRLKDELAKRDEEIEALNNKLGEIKNQYVMRNISFESTEKKAKELEAKVEDLTRKNIRLEAQLKNQGAI